MTSTFDHSRGPSLGWINRPVIQVGVLPEGAARGRLEEHIHVFGGEERLWMGPEGGQNALFFKPQTPFEYRTRELCAHLASLGVEVSTKDMRRFCSRYGIRHDVRLLFVDQAWSFRGFGTKIRVP